MTSQENWFQRYQLYSGRSNHYTNMLFITSLSQPNCTFWLPEAYERWTSFWHFSRFQLKLLEEFYWTCITVYLNFPLEKTCLMMLWLKNLLETDSLGFYSLFLSEKNLKSQYWQIVNWHSAIHKVIQRMKYETVLHRHSNAVHIQQR